jgi:hypothetical protein
MPPTLVSAPHPASDMLHESSSHAELRAFSAAWVAIMRGSWVAGDDCAEPVSGAVMCGYESGLVVSRTGWRAA